LLGAGWIVVRAVSTIITVPVAEELAYRGFLLRRWQSAGFESLQYAAVRWPALLATSVLFGLSHGAMWPAGIVAGGVYGALAIRTGRLGESVLAHATTNALLTAQVLFAGQWQYW
jgi:CAAX prenyl protease-like protein